MEKHEIISEINTIITTIKGNGKSELEQCGEIIPALNNFLEINQPQFSIGPVDTFEQLEFALNILGLK